MTKMCRQTLGSQGAELADALAGMAYSFQPLPAKADFDEIAGRKQSVGILSQISDKGNIKYFAYDALDFDLASALDADNSLDKDAIAEQLQDWNGKVYEIAWNPLSLPDDERGALAQALEARRTWPKLQAKFEAGTLLYNTPTPDKSPDSYDDDYRNTRARLYERNGFGKLERVEGLGPGFAPRQLAIVQSDGSLRPVQTMKLDGIVNKYAETKCQ